MDKGFIKLHRKIQDHWLFEEKRTFSKFEAWIDMLLMANHKENKVVLGNELITIERGQFITSIRKLGERWNWSNTKVTNFLEILKQDEMITYKKDTKKTVITIVKYSVYHDNENAKTTRERHDKDTKATREHTNKNVKNVKNNKEYIYSRKLVYDDTHFSLAKFFYQQILKNNPQHKKPNLEKWANEIRLMMERDGRTAEQIKYLMQWVQQDEFEMVNVLSPSKLRKRFDQLVLKVKQEKNKQPKRERQPKINVSELEDWQEEMARIIEGR